jgi:hypothetical protein
MSAKKTTKRIIGDDVPADAKNKSKTLIPKETKEKPSGTNHGYTQKIVDSGVSTYQKRLLVGTATTGPIRMEWAAARYGQAIPANWSKVDMLQYMNSFIPLRYTIADAQNMIVQEAITNNYQWVLFIEHDTIPPPDGFLRFSEYIRSEEFPVVSGLYFTRSDPAEPMIYRGRGNSYFRDWKLGDVVMADGVPTGMLLMNTKLLKAVWDDSPEYVTAGVTLRRVFDTISKTWFNEEKGSQEALVGTSDLDFCKRVIEGDYMTKAGWPQLGASKVQFPFAVDTNIACMQIEQDGTQFPLQGVYGWCQMNGCLPE